MTLPPVLEALKNDALRTSCHSWAVRRRWPLMDTGGELVGPCPRCGDGGKKKGRSDRFSINKARNLFNCRKCGIAGEGVIKLVMETEGVDFTRACEIVTGRAASEPIDPAEAERLADEQRRQDERRAAEAERYREEARRAGYQIYVAARVSQHRDTVEAYLALRGLPLDERLSLLVRLVEHPDLPLMEKVGGSWQQVHRGVAMVAALQQPDGHFGAAHMTWLDLEQPKGKVVLPPHPDTGKPIPVKKMRGIQKGCAIRLITPEKPRRIVMGEGIETTLTAAVHNFEPETAYWAAGSLGNMAGRAARDANGKTVHDQPDMDDLECFLVPDWCEELVYLCDSDEPETRTVEKATRGLIRQVAVREQRRLENPALAELATSFVEPIGDGKDLNDLVRAG